MVAFKLLRRTELGVLDIKGSSDLCDILGVLVRLGMRKVSFMMNGRTGLKIPRHTGTLIIVHHILRTFTILRPHYSESLLIDHHFIRQNILICHNFTVSIYVYNVQVCTNEYPVNPRNWLIYHIL